MAIFGKKKTTQVETKSFDPKTHKPVLRCSICTGEQVFGFRNMETGKFEEVSLIRNEQELAAFMQLYDISQVTKEY